MNPSHKANEIEAKLDVCVSEKGRKVLERKLREIQIAAPKQSRVALCQEIQRLQAKRKSLNIGERIAAEMVLNDLWDIFDRQVEQDAEETREENQDRADLWRMGRGG